MGNAHGMENNKAQSPERAKYLFCYLLISKRSLTYKKATSHCRKSSSGRFQDAIIKENVQESRKEWMLNPFGFAGGNNKSNKD
jgi:hypothetical protein